VWKIKFSKTILILYCFFPSLLILFDLDKMDRLMLWWTDGNEEGAPIVPFLLFTAMGIELEDTSMKPKVNCPKFGLDTIETKGLASYLKRDANFSI
jgi:hypothetical protein